MDSGKLEFGDGKATYTYKGIVYDLGSYPYEPCLYIIKDDVHICTLHNAYTVEQLRKTFTAGGKVRNYQDTVYDEEAFCRVLAAVLDNKRNDMDFFYAAKLVKDQ